MKDKKKRNVGYSITKTQINLLIFGIVIGAIIIFAIGVIIGMETGEYKGKASQKLAALPADSSSENEEFLLNFEDELLKKNMPLQDEEIKVEKGKGKEEPHTQVKLKERADHDIGRVIIPIPKAKQVKKKFVVQVAAYRAKFAADTLNDKLRKKGYPSYIAKAEIYGKGVLYRVRIGNFDNRNMAEQYANKLRKDEHFSPFITRIAVRE